MSASPAITVLLNAANGWGAAARSDFAETAAGALVLRPVPGNPHELFPGRLAARGITLADIALEADGRRSAWGLDRARECLIRLNLVTEEFEAIFAVGGPGSRPRQFQHAGGLAVLPTGGFAVADTGNHRVQVFGPAPRFPLLAVYGAVDATGRPRPGSDAGEFDHPLAVAAAPDGTIYVADTGNRRVQRLGPDGRVIEVLGQFSFEYPFRLAVGPNDTLAVVDRQAVAGAEVTRVLTVRSRALVPMPLDADRLDTPLSVAFAPDGRLAVGTARGSIHLFEEDDVQSSGYRPAGRGSIRRDAAVEQVAWAGDVLLAAIRELDREAAVPPTVWRFDPAGGNCGRASLEVSAQDSGLPQCSWDRVTVKATLPAGSRLVVRMQTSDEPGVPEPADRAPADLTFEGREGEATSREWVGLIRTPPGRYLRLVLDVSSDGRAVPAVESIRLDAPRDGYLKYLPAVFQEDVESKRFLERFLGLFQASFDEMGRGLDRVPLHFDPHTVEADRLPWLATWLGETLPRGIDGWLDPGLARRVLAAAGALQPWRGTKAGIEAAIRLKAGLPARVLEHYKLRPWAALTDRGLSLTEGLNLAQTGDRAQADVRPSGDGPVAVIDAPPPDREWLARGANTFSVIYTVRDPYRADEARATVAAVVELEKPAHTVAAYQPAFPRLRVGVQATLGIDAVVGTVHDMALNELATLGYDTILAGRDAAPGPSQLDSTASVGGVLA